MKVELTKHELTKYIYSLTTMLKIVNGDDEWLDWKTRMESMINTMDLIKELEEENERDMENKS